jgi:hypothetical protein
VHKALYDTIWFSTGAVKAVTLSTSLSAPLKSVAKGGGASGLASGVASAMPKLIESFSFKKLRLAPVSRASRRLQGGEGLSAMRLEGVVTVIVNNPLGARLPINIKKVGYIVYLCLFERPEHTPCIP